MAREDGPVDHAAHLLGLDRAVAEDLVYSRVNRHHAVKDARLRIGIDLDEDFALVHDVRLSMAKETRFREKPGLCLLRRCVSRRCYL